MDINEFKRQFGLCIQNYRRRHHMTQEDLTECIQRSTDTISNIEQGINSRQIEITFQAYEGRQYNWSLESTLDDSIKALPDIYVTESDEIIGYIQNISIDLAFAEARVGHFATVADMVRQGVGRKMVGSFVRAVSEKFGIKQLVFSENSTKYIEAGYPGFFAAIGARPIEVGNRRPDWLLAVDGL